MKKSVQLLKVIASQLIVIGLLTFLFPKIGFAGDLGTLVRIDRAATTKSTGGTICTTPETNGTENQIQVVFPTGFTVNQTASNWTVTTTNLPSGSVAVPGISTATAVVGQIVTFPISDLTTGTQYCFNFSSTNTLTTPSSTGTYVGILRTLNSSSNVVDYRAFGTSIITNDAINVTASVAANPTDFQANLTLSDPTNGTFAQNTTLTYTLTYGNLLSYPANITVEASWDLGTIQGSSTASVDILDYVIGSASNGYNNTAPVIDSVNRKIDWTISAIPGNTTGQTVTFKLRTNNSYTASLPVTFTVNGRTYGPGTVTPDSTVTSYYQNTTYITPTPTPTCTSSTCPTSTPTAGTPTPTPTNTPARSTYPVITDIQLRTVSSSDAAILVITDRDTSIRINYGTDIKNLSKLALEKDLSTEHLVKISDLNPASRYYYKVTVFDANGNGTTSDIYVLDTAIPSIPPQVVNNSLILTSNDVVLSDPLKAMAQLPLIVIPVDTPYSFKFAIAGYENIKSIEAIVRNSKVLGISTFPVFANPDFVTITEITPGEYIGKLQSNLQPGKYRIVIQIQDFNGNISEQTLSILYAVNTFRIINKVTKDPIERAKVTFSYLNPRLKTYEILSSNITPVKNPNYSEPDGNVMSVLPVGKYRAEITAIGFEDKTVDFEIGPNTSNYPKVELKPLPFNIITFAKYTALTANDVLILIKEYMHTLRKSIRFFDLVAVVIASLLVVLLTISTSRRLSVPLHKLPYFCIYFLERILHHPTHTYPLHGTITTTGGEIVPGALVYISHPSGKVITHTTTNSDGEFYTNIRESLAVKVIVSKKGFRNITVSVGKDILDDKIEIQLLQLKKPEGLGYEALYWYTSYISGTLFETILILTLATEFLFVLEFGWVKVLPFIGISLTNVFLWAANARATRS